MSIYWIYHSTSDGTTKVYRDWHHERDNRFKWFELVLIARKVDILDSSECSVNLVNPQQTFRLRVKEFLNPK
jgi:hypothetical protein